MNVRRVTPGERKMLQPWRAGFVGPRRVLDAEEQRQLIHLYRTKQAPPPELAARYGVSVRTFWRYLSVHPQQTEYERAARAVYREAAGIGLELSRDDSIRLAIAALAEPAA